MASSSRLTNCPQPYSLVGILTKLPRGISSVDSAARCSPALGSVPAQGGFELIAGERRWRAAQLMEPPMPAVKKESPIKRPQLALVENIQREDLGALEQAIGLERLRNEFELTQQQLADIVGNLERPLPTTCIC